MAYNWNGDRTRQRRAIRFLIALLYPALLLGVAIGIAEWAAQKENANVGESRRAELNGMRGN